MIYLLSSAEKVYMLGQFIVVPLFAFWIAIVSRSKSWIYGNPVVVFFGEVSYSFYLWQFVAILAGAKIIETCRGINLTIVVAIAFLINFSLSIISYYLIEVKSRRYILHRFSAILPKHQVCK
jgi:peptidoglycan/LPS O-acetylase OafA/YrhL